MGVYIKGMEMPKEGTQRVMFITIDSTGLVELLDFDTHTLIEAYHAVPVPPHGDLIDYNFCVKNFELLHDDDGNPVYAVRMRELNAAPAIIPAEEGK